jgi:biopolymer transport protein ExbD
MMEKQPINRRDVFLPLVAGGVATAVLGTAGPAAAAPGEVALAKVPAAIKEAAERVVKGAKWSQAIKSREEDQEVYELVGEDARGKTLTIEVSSDGKVMAVERQIDVKDLPKPVSDAVSAKFPAFKAENVLEMYLADDIRDLSKAELAYQLNGTAAKGKDLTVEVTADGKITEVKREIDLEEVPKPVMVALKSKAPLFRVEIVHKVTRGDTVAGFLFAGKKRRIAYVSSDGKEIEIHKDE